MKPVTKFCALLVATCLLIVVVYGALFFSYKAPDSTVLFFPEGTPLRKISGQLKDAKVVMSARGFEIYVRLRGRDKAIKAGEYEFRKGATVVEILHMMEEGKVRLYPLTIPEGFNLGQIGDLIFLNGIATEHEWGGLIRSASFVRSLKVPSDSLEGYLFPETYLYDRTTTAEKLIRRMTELFFERISPDMIHRLQQKGLSLHQWVTLASLVEKETAVPGERPLIASVFFNRLNKKMPLQTDPSVIYGLEGFDGNLTRKNLETDHPYNTYTRQGLPVGPICSPGLDSLMAVLNPSSTDYLYFVSKGDGSHHFSKTLEEHNRAVSFYQLHRGPHPSP